MSSQEVSLELYAAAARLQQSGPSAFSMEALARASGPSHATLYPQYTNRESLLASLAAAGVDVGEQDIGERSLVAARSVLARAGFDAATLEAVAKLAGVAPVTVYRQFKDKGGDGPGKGGPS